MLIPFEGHKEQPEFNIFISKNINNICKWSSSYFGKSKTELYSMWRQRFVYSLKSHSMLESINSSKQYHAEIWENIQTTARTMAIARFKVQREAMDSLGAAVRPMKEILDDLVRGESSSSTPQQQSTSASSSSTPPQEEPEISSHKNFDELNVEAQLHFISYKKLSGETLTNDETKILSDITNDGTIKSSLRYVAAQRLLKNDLDYLDNAIIKLSLSRIVNLIEPKLKQSVLVHLNDEEKSRLQAIFTPPSLPQLEEETQDFLLSIKNAAETGDLETVLSLTLERKLECVKAKSTSSQLYQCISCLDHILSLIGSWDQEAKESEITFYRRSATILDYIFKNTDIILNDGETGSPASKREITTNKVLFMTNDSSPSYSRKIDLLLKCKEMKTAVELCSNEWKRSSVSESMKLHQQSKNLRVNSAILNDMRKYDIQQTMAMDWIGCSGYLYSLKWVAEEEIYVATLLTDIHVSTGLTLLYDDMSRMMTALFGFKHMLSSTARKVKGKIEKDKRKRKLPIPNEDTPSLATLAAVTEGQQEVHQSSLSLNYFVEPVFVFFTPKSNRTKRPRNINEDEDDDNNDEFNNLQ
ncbi:hypothetical protein INT45_004864 [Circinella minor]|uniref:Uncharacterized protein n=1 Tax=Circinella minor TaxID=1195481 RepID=A0A8H7RUG7_9FUNG|nr:hypothetical protein INT45_004864 [Circinella minor]